MVCLNLFLNTSFMLTDYALTFDKKPYRKKQLRS